ncbi:MAG: hypothetical protein HOW73_22680 [Polyangiaceae bacterium]|nr:hypothetical protein [Polyangiaceae bacterium]
MTTLSPMRFRRLCCIVFGLTVVAAAILAVIGVPDAAIPRLTPGRRVLIAVRLCVGPLSALASVSECSIAEACPALAIVTLVCLLPVGFAIRYRSDVALVLSAMFWLGVGYLYTVAIWI